MTMTSSESDGAALGTESARPVRRNLFGPVDHQQLQQDFQRLLRANVEVANRRWNFDFQRDRPAPGSVEWEELRCQDVPAFYRSCVVRRGAVEERQADAASPASSADDEYLEVTAMETYRIQKPGERGPKHRQAAITDFYTVKKRRLLHHKSSSWQ